jgi:hypothetical protein
MLHDPKYTKWPQNRPNGHKIDHHLPLQYPPKFTQIENMPSGNSGGDVGLVGRELAGEYLPTGSFMVRGKKNFLPPSHLVRNPLAPSRASENFHRSLANLKNNHTI